MIHKNSSSVLTYQTLIFTKNDSCLDLNRLLSRYIGENEILYFMGYEYFRSRSVYVIIL